MDHNRIADLKQYHPVLRLLAADSAPLVLGFLFNTFVAAERRAIGLREAETLLDDYLFGLRQSADEENYPRRAIDYLNQWASDDTGWIRKYLPETGDEPLVDITPATEKAIEWLQSLEAQNFIGTESRLLTIIELLRGIVAGAETDSDRRLAELERRKAEIEDEIAQVARGQFEPFDDRQITERTMQAEDTARKLLRDFRQVEDNFRALDRATRQRIATGNATKGNTLDAIFADHGAIRDSDQGRSFRAFWELLLSAQSKSELVELIERTLQLAPLQQRSGPLANLLGDLQQAGGSVTRTLMRLNEQLRRYLDDRLLAEQRRIGELIGEIEQIAGQVSDNPPDDKAFMRIASRRPTIDDIPSRQLFVPPEPVRLDSDSIALGDADVGLGALFDQTVIDLAQLHTRIQTALSSRDRVRLPELIEVHPLEHGVAELVGYLHLAHQDEYALVDEKYLDRITISNSRKTVDLPRVIYTKQP